MRAFVVYESMYGNTHAVADHVADGLRSCFDVTESSVSDVTADLISAADLLVVGGPTHAHGLSTRSTRGAAADAAKKDPSLSLEPVSPTQPGLRDWLRSIPDGQRGPIAAFDTRLRAPAAFTGRASVGIARRLRRRGFQVVAKPESFIVDKHDLLLDGEAQRAETWGAGLARSFNATGDAAIGSAVSRTIDPLA